jgi:thiol-disulfide isomerase/thioredoxin
MKRYVLAGIVFILFIGGSYVLFFDFSAEKNDADISLHSAPDIILTDIQGRRIALADYRGRYVLVNAWASWCPFCLAELPLFTDLKKRLGEELVVIAVNRGETEATAKQYTEQLNLGDSLVFALDPEHTFYKAIGGFSMPETIFIDKEGNIRQHKRGPMDLEEIMRRSSEAFGF